MMKKIGYQKGNVALIMVVVLMTMGLLLLKAIHYYQERARDELLREIKYVEVFNQAESALAWGLGQLWKGDRSRKASWECKQVPTLLWHSCLKHYSGSIFILSGKSNFKQGEQINVYRWVKLVAGTQKIQARTQSWLDYCPVEKKGFCL
ncbi:DUF2509 family protein [Providencia heimbachae]|nr:DUF2509 family protein [Providencia heimbachae]SQH14421.1 Protein of uncharacterised function (DUF2509) [Providencia heimbachae]